MAFVKVVLFKPSGKYYTEEQWRVPEGAIGPYDMERSPDFRRIGGGAVLVETQEPWGFPHMFPSIGASGDGPHDPSPTPMVRHERSPNRIVPILETIAGIWAAHPDLRLTQLVWSLGARIGVTGREAASQFFNTEDDKLRWNRFDVHAPTWDD